MFCHAHVFQLGPNQHPKRFDSQKSPARVPPLCRLSCPVFWLSTDCKVPFCAAFRRVCAASLRKASRSCRDAQENCPQTTSCFFCVSLFLWGVWFLVFYFKDQNSGLRKCFATTGQFSHFVDDCLIHTTLHCLI